MPVARSFCIAGGALLIIGLILWWALPLSLAIPPYLITGVLALAYGFFCWKRRQQSAVPPHPVGKAEPRE